MMKIFPNFVVYCTYLLLNTLLGYNFCGVYYLA